MGKRFPIYSRSRDKAESIYNPKRSGDRDQDLILIPVISSRNRGAISRSRPGMAQSRTDQAGSVSIEPTVGGRDAPQGRVHGELVKGNLPASLFNERHGRMSRSLVLRQSSAGIGIRKQGLGRGVSAGWRLGGAAPDSAVGIECGAGGCPAARTGRGWLGRPARTSLDR